MFCLSIVFVGLDRRDNNTTGVVDCRLRKQRCGCGEEAERTLNELKPNENEKGNGDRVSHSLLLRSLATNHLRIH